MHLPGGTQGLRAIGIAETCVQFGIAQTRDLANLTQFRCDRQRRLFGGQTSPRARPCGLLQCDRNNEYDVVVMAMVIMSRAVAELGTGRL